MTRQISNEVLFNEYLKVQAENISEKALIIFYYWKCLKNKMEISYEYFIESKEDIEESLHNEFLNYAIADFLDGGDSNKNGYNNDENDFTEDLDLNFAMSLIYGHGWLDKEGIIYDDKTLDRDEIEFKSILDDNSSFQRYSIDLKCLSILYDNFSLIVKNFGESKYRLFFNLEDLKNKINNESSELIGYWKSKDKRIRASRFGSRVKIKYMQDRIKKIKCEVEKVGIPVNGALELNISKWHQIFMDVFEMKIPISYPTLKKYQKAIERMLSEEKNRKIEIIFKK